MKKKGIVLLLITFLFGFGFVSKARSQSSLLFTVSPARQQIIANAGEEFPISVTFYNRGETPVSGLIKTSDFIVEDDKGTPTIIENTNQTLSKYSASAWVSLPYDRINIGPNNKAVVKATLKIPVDARPGGRYAAIYFEPVGAAQPRSEAGASITPRIASLIYIRVSGPISENAYISSIFTNSFYEFGPIDVSAKIMNKGDYHIRPKGSFTLSNLFGGVSATTKLKEVNIFPDTQFSYKTTIGEKWMMGRYKLTLQAIYGSRDQIMEHTLYVWVFPWRATIIAVLFLFGIFFGGRYFYKNFIQKESVLEEELSKEKEEISQLKKQLEEKS